jgi:hypothetical protein
MATPTANPHLAQEFIRLLHNENSILQQRVTELERVATASVCLLYILVQRVAYMVGIERHQTTSLR